MLEKKSNNIYYRLSMIFLMVSYGSLCASDQDVKTSTEKPLFENLLINEQNEILEKINHQNTTKQKKIDFLITQMNDFSNNILGEYLKINPQKNRAIEEKFPYNVLVSLASTNNTSDENYISLKQLCALGYLYKITCYGEDFIENNLEELEMLQETFLSFDSSSDNVFLGKRLYPVLCDILTIRNNDIEKIYKTDFDNISPFVGLYLLYSQKYKKSKKIFNILMKYDYLQKFFLFDINWYLLTKNIVKEPEKNFIKNDSFCFKLLDFLLTRVENKEIEEKILTEEQCLIIFAIANHTSNFYVFKKSLLLLDAYDVNLKCIEKFAYKRIMVADCNDIRLTKGSDESVQKDPYQNKFLFLLEPPLDGNQNFIFVDTIHRNYCITSYAFNTCDNGIEILKKIIAEPMDTETYFCDNYSDKVGAAKQNRVNNVSMIRTIRDRFSEQDFFLVSIFVVVCGSYLGYYLCDTMRAS